MSAHGPAVVVVGSLNTDYVLRVDHLPASGETITGRDYLVSAGGKGLNQAVAAARQGATVAFVGCVGGDDAGRALLELLAGEGVDVRHVRAVPDSATGVALITVASDGANTIVVAPLANACLSPADIAGAGSLISGAAVVLAQMEVPVAVVSAALAAARAARVVTVLNPAPASGPLPAGLLGLVDILIPNETEAAALSGIAGVAGVAGVAGGEAAAVALLRAGVPQVIVTMGRHGAVVANQTGVRRVAPFPVRAVDSTGAGDAFCGALVAALAGGLPLPAACRRASAAGALAATVAGAVPSLPTAAMVDDLLGQ